MRHNMKTAPPPKPSEPPVLGVIYGNRDFFPDTLVTAARADMQLAAVPLDKMNAKE